MRYIKRYFISILIALTLVYFITKDYPLDSLIPVIRETNYKYVLFGLIAMSGMFLLGGFRWKFLYPMYSIEQSINGVIIAVAANTIIPMRGGEVVRAHFLSKETGIEIVQLIGNIIIERTTDMISLLVLLFISGAVLGEIVKSDSNYIVLLGFISGSTIYIFFFIYRMYHIPIDEKLNKIKAKGKIFSFLKNKLTIILLPFKETKFYRIIVAQILSFGISFLGISLLYFFLLSVNIKVDYSSIVLIFPLIALSISLPISIGYVGVYHAATIIALSYIGVKDADLVGKVIIIHLLSIIPPLLYGWLLLSFTRIKSISLSEYLGKIHS